MARRRDPPSPAGRIITTARNRAIDRYRRESTRVDRYRQAELLRDDTPTAEEGPVLDDRLRLVFTCCHPALSTAVQVALTLRLLADQDRSRRTAALIAEGQDPVRSCLRRNAPGPYQIQAAINAVHSDAVSAQDTDWGQILALYDQLMAVAPSPVVALNRAVALAEEAGPAAAPAVMDDLDLAQLDLFHAVRADLLRRLGRAAEAGQAYSAAIERAGIEPERTFLTHRLESLD